MCLNLPVHTKVCSPAWVLKFGVPLFTVSSLAVSCLFDHCCLLFPHDNCTALYPAYYWLLIIVYQVSFVQSSCTTTSVNNSAKLPALICACMTNSCYDMLLPDPLDGTVVGCFHREDGIFWHLNLVSRQCRKTITLHCAMLHQFCPKVAMLHQFCPKVAMLHQFCPKVATLPQFCPKVATLPQFCPKVRGVSIRWTHWTGLDSLDWTGLTGLDWTAIYAYTHKRHHQVWGREYNHLTYRGLFPRRKSRT